MSRWGTPRLVVTFSNWVVLVVPTATSMTAALTTIRSTRFREARDGGRASFPRGRLKL